MFCHVSLRRALKIVFLNNCIPLTPPTLSKSLKTFTEGTTPGSSDTLEIKGHMSEADRIVFLGFAFHKLNMNAIAPLIPASTSLDVPKCYATTHGISDSDKRWITNQILNLYNAAPFARLPESNNIHLANLRCKELFTEFWRSLSF